MSATDCTDKYKGVHMRLGFLAKILPPAENRFYDYFEEAAEVCQLSAYLF